MNAVVGREEQGAVYGGQVPWVRRGRAGVDVGDELGREPESPGVEFRMAIVGPLTSFALGGLAFVAIALVEGRATLAAILRYLTLVNFAVGIFNLVPGFPLDGGRVLRAALWRAKGNLRWATRVASRAGSIVALGLTRVVGDRP